jgi:hypothetical protein
MAVLVKASIKITALLRTAVSGLQSVASQLGQEILNTEAAKRIIVEAATKQRVREDIADWEDLEGPVVVCRLCRIVKLVLIIANTKHTINSVINPNSVWTVICDYK